MAARNTMLAFTDAAVARHLEADNHSVTAVDAAALSQVSPFMMHKLQHQISIIEDAYGVPTPPPE